MPSYGLCVGCSDKNLLNATIRAYLVQEGYKLTALTLSEEATGSIADALPLTSGTLADMFQGNARQAAATAAQQVSSCVHLDGLPQAVAYLLTQVDLQPLF